DGIRYFHVTAVQTCALPISSKFGLFSSATPPRSLPAAYLHPTCNLPATYLNDLLYATNCATLLCIALRVVTTERGDWKYSERMFNALPGTNLNVHDAKNSCATSFVPDGKYVLSFCDGGLMQLRVTMYESCTSTLSQANQLKIINEKLEIESSFNVMPKFR